MITANYKNVYVNGNVMRSDKKINSFKPMFGEVRTNAGNHPVEKLILKSEEWITKDNDETSYCGCEEYRGIILTAETAYEQGIIFEFSFS